MTTIWFGQSYKDQDHNVCLFAIESEAYAWLREFPAERTIFEVEAKQFMMYADGSGAPWEVK